MRRYRVLIGVGVTCLVAVLLLLGGLLTENSPIIGISQFVLIAISIFLTVWGIKQLVKGIKSTLISKPGKGRILGRARLPVLVLAVFGVFTLLGFQIGTVRWLTPPETPGVHCGDIGVEGYQPTSLPVTVPDIILERGIVITVTNSSNVFDAHAMTVPELLANPGPDGISYREALELTNNDPGVYTIRFADHLVGATIDLDDWHTSLLGGNVIINGDITGDGRPDITIDGGPLGICPFVISSSGNTIHALTIQNFRVGVILTNEGSVTNTTFANNVVSNLQMRDIDEVGIQLCTKGGDTTKPAPMAGNRWVNTLIIGNTIEAGKGGINFHLRISAGNRIEKTRIINNTIRTEGAYNHGEGISLTAGLWDDADNNEIVDTLIANNTIELGAFGDSQGVRVASGDNGACRNIIDGVRIVGNRITMARPGDSEPVQAGIFLITGDSPTTFMDPTYRPITYPDYNTIRNVWIEDNIVKGRGECGIEILSGWRGSRYNTIKDVFVLGNLVDIEDLGLFYCSPRGIFISGGSPVGAKRTIGPNEVSDISIQWNTIRMSNPSRFMLHPEDLCGSGVLIYHAVNNAATGILVSHNDIAGGSIIDIGDKGVPRMGLVRVKGIMGIMDIMLDTAPKTLDGIDDLEVEYNRVVGPSMLVVNLHYLAIAVAVAGLLARRLGKRKA